MYACLIAPADYTDREQVKALMSELKVLIHIGQHLNVLNLLGAVTKDTQRGKCSPHCRQLSHQKHSIDQLSSNNKYAGCAKDIVRVSSCCACCLTLLGNFYVIVEYCKYGSLRDYLVEKRADFVDTMDDGKKARLLQKRKEAAAANQTSTLNYVNIRSADDDDSDDASEQQ